jgi:photosystem II stability/assembly factor-like uncharacterized protein
VTWAPQTSGSTAALNAVAASPTAIVTVGAAGTILSSPDGATWTAQTSGIIKILNSILWTGTRFVVVGEFGNVLTSPDGVAWTTVASGTLQELKAVVMGPGLLVTVGGSGVVYTSPNGDAWTAQTAPGTGIKWGVAYSAPKQLYVIAATDGYYTSADGLSWTGSDPGVLLDTQRIVWAPSLGEFVGVGGGNIVTTPDGRNFAKASTTQLTFGALNAVAASPTRVVAVGNGGSIVTAP